MATDFLANLTTPDLLNQIAPIKNRITRDVCSRVVLEPLSIDVYFGMGSIAVVQEKMANYAPGRGNLKFSQEVEEPVNDSFAFYLARFLKAIWPENIEGSPDQFEIQTECKNAFRKQLSVQDFLAITRNMFESSRRSGMSDTRASTGSQDFKIEGRMPGARCSTQFRGPL